MSKLLKVKRMYASNQKQQGMSLMGLMVGMLLSVLSILAAMTMYHNMVDVAIDTRQAAQHDAQLATALQTIQLELLSAGYGITDAKVGTDLVVGGTQKLYWRYKDTPTSATFTCRGVHYAPTPAGASPVGFELTLVEKNSCTALAGGAWVQVQKLAMFINDPGINFTSTTGSCFPYGRSTAADHGMVTITAQSAASIETAGGVPISTYTTCLPNLHKPTTISP